MFRITPAILVAFFLLAFSFAASSQTVTGSIRNGTVRRGVAARASVVLSLPKELHVNSNRPGSEYLIPTVVRLSAKGVKLGGVSYPRAHDRKFQFSEKPLNVYEGTVVFPFRVTVPGNYRGNSITVNATIEYQACTEELCYQPRKEVVRITARVR